MLIKRYFTQNAIRPVQIAILLFLLPSCFLAKSSLADVVKPALVEISVFTEGRYRIELRASIEAIMTGINSQYKNTQDSPFAEAYDQLRALQSAQLREKFNAFEPQLRQHIRLSLDGKAVPLTLTELKIPEPGYTKVPRVSVMVFEGSIAREVQQLSWYYPARFSDNAVRVRQVDADNGRYHWSAWQWIRNDQPSQAFKLHQVFTQPPFLDTAVNYIQVGFAHIIPKGLDHILFILGLFLLSTRLKTLVWQATMFTLAHSITLSLAMFGVIELPASLVEPLIALSIAYIAIENLLAHKLKTSRMVLVFLFGLLHGLGFASVLTDFGLPRDAYAIALVSFNIGVELAQIAILLLAYFSLSLWIKDRQVFYKYITLPGSLLIGIIGLYWTWDRFSWPLL